MLSVIIPTLNNERALVPTLAMLVQGVIAGAIRDVVIADGGSTDATAEVVEAAGCVWMPSREPLGNRLREAARAAHGTWLMFLRPGATLDPTWVSETDRFIEDTAVQEGAKVQAAVFRRATSVAGARSLPAELATVFISRIGSPSPDQGLIITRALYDDVGGHRDESEPEAGLLRRLGRRRIARLRSEIRVSRPGA